MMGLDSSVVFTYNVLFLHVRRCVRIVYITHSEQNMPSVKYITSYRFFPISVHILMLKDILICNV